MSLSQAGVLRLTPEVESALRDSRPLVALESSVLAQGLPIPANREAANRMTHAVRAHGATPAFTGVVRGVVTAGLLEAELDRFLGRDGVLKLSARDIPLAILRLADGATTVAASLAISRLAGIRVFATGGIGGVHREPAYDESADLNELARTSAIVVCAGIKSILDVEGTMERLETLGVPVVGYRTWELAGFFTTETGVRLSMRAESPKEIVALYTAHRAVGGTSAVVVAQPLPPDEALSSKLVEPAIVAALALARGGEVRGAALTPHLLAAVELATDGRSRRANLALLERNSRLAAEIAVELSSGL